MPRTSQFTCSWLRPTILGLAFENLVFLLKTYLFIPTAQIYRAMSYGTSVIIASQMSSFILTIQNALHCDYFIMTFIPHSQIYFLENQLCTFRVNGY